MDKHVLADIYVKRIAHAVVKFSRYVKLCNALKLGRPAKEFPEFWKMSGSNVYC